MFQSWVKIFWSKPPLQASMVYAKSPCPCQYVKDSSWALSIKEYIIWCKLGLIGLLHQVSLIERWKPLYKGNNSTSFGKHLQQVRSTVIGEEKGVKNSWKEEKNPSERNPRDESWRVFYFSFDSHMWNFEVVVGLKLQGYNRAKIMKPWAEILTRSWIKAI